jgi:mycoredoxin
MDINQKFKLELEIKNARAARSAGLEGRARVGARRAAAILVRDYLQQRNGSVPALNDLQILSFLMESSSSPRLSDLLAEYLEQVDPLYHLPSGADLIADLDELALLLEREVNPVKPKPQVIIYGTEWCPDCTRAKRILISAGVEFIWLDVHANPEYEDFVMRVNNGNCSVPTILFPNGEVLVEPSNENLLRAISENTPD